jgi:PAS domain S-box-containing protein
MASILATVIFGVSESAVFNPPYLLLILNLIFWSGATVAIAYISAKTFLHDGTLTVLLTGASIIILGVSVILSGWVASFSGDHSVAIGNICPLAASILQLTGGLYSLTRRGESPIVRRKNLLIVAYATAFIFVGVVSVIVLSGSLPQFFSSSGPTLLRQSVLGSTVLVFGAALIAFVLQYAESRAPVLLWYSLAIALFSLGFFMAFEVRVIGDVPTWLGRVTLYTGNFYLLAALLESRKTSAGLSNGWAEAFRSHRSHIETLFSKMLNGFSYHRIIVDEKGKPVDYVFLGTNEAFEKMTGLKRGNVIGKKVTEVLPGIEKDPADWIGIYGKVALTGQPVTFESFAQPLQKWYSVSAYSLEKGYFVTILEDITERKKAEQKLEEYAKNLEVLIEERTKKLEASALYARSLLEASLDPLVTISPEGKITDVNKATELATGCSREELIGSDFSNYFTEPEKAAAGYKQVFTEGSVTDYPLAIRHKSGKVTEVLYNASVYRDAQDRVQGVFAAARDITERKNLEKQLQEKERLAAIGSTAGMVGHDIRNPLQAILGDLYLVKDEVKSLRNSSKKTNLNESISAIEENILYINKIVSDLQDYTRPLRPSSEEFNLEKVIADVLIQNNVPDNIKTSSEVDAEVKTLNSDRAFVKRVIENLVLNAIQSMPQGGKLAVKAGKETGAAVITVEDTGGGIPEGVRPKLFAPLFTTKSKGQGFGLAVVKRMTEALGGTVTFESEVGKGTKFIIHLPLQY